jgi:cell division protease FtsH
MYRYFVTLVWGAGFASAFFHNAIGPCNFRLWNIDRSSKVESIERVKKSSFSKIINATALRIDLFDNADDNQYRKYPLSQSYYEKFVKRLNSRNLTEEDEDDELEPISPPKIQIILNKNMLESLGYRVNEAFNSGNNNDDYDDDDFDETDGDNDNYGNYRNRVKKNSPKKSDNFEVVTKHDFSFKNIGGYSLVKEEFKQCIDLLKNYTKYAKFNVRVPKGLILEGPPGNGKTLLAKGMAGEARVNFIAVSGSEFQDKYVGVGASRIRELFSLARKNIPCIIFIDEIDALGRSRSKDGEAATSERDSTLNELLVALDGFKNTSGIFLIGATNRADLLDSALLRPGRIDKRIYIGNPDEDTRREIIYIHSRGKPMNSEVNVEDLVTAMEGLSGAQIENILNEAMLNALRNDRFEFSMSDIDSVLDKMMVGWQPNKHEFSEEGLQRISIHELGHAVVGLVSKNHANMTKIIINLSSPKSPAYTVFKTSNSPIYTRESLFEHLMILLAGRVAEEVFYGKSVTTGASNDFEEALALAQNMVKYYGYGECVIYPHENSEKYKEIIDDNVMKLIQDAYSYTEFIIQNSKDFILEGADILIRDRVVYSEDLIKLMTEKYDYVDNLKYLYIK